MTCSFCGNEPHADRWFDRLDDSVRRGACICYDCVRDLYISMIAAEMRPPRPVRNVFTDQPSGRAQVIRLHPRSKD